MAQSHIAAINAGSSSVKFAVFAGEEARLHGQVEGIGVHPMLHVATAPGAPLRLMDIGLTPRTTPAETVPLFLSWLRKQLGGDRLAGIGHRVVHGGTRYVKPTLVTPDVVRDLEALIPLAPLHEPYNIAPMKATLLAHPDLPQVACFDTAFHSTMPAMSYTFALPLEYLNEGIRRYGFHGSSYEYIASVLPGTAPNLAGGRVIVMHLGNGASACALHSGVSIATTMTFTALDGLPMGTRCGELDPAVVLYLGLQKGLPLNDIQDILYRKSGVLGLSGISSDFRDLLASSAPQAAFAIDVFCYRVARQIGSLAAALGGLDGLVFTAGIGEHASPIRAKICKLSAWLGVTLDDAANDRHGPRISRDGSAVEVWVIPTNEELMIARHTRSLVQDKPGA